MKPKTISWHQIGLASCIFCMFSSCYPGGGISDPYIVTDSRQRENFYYVPSSANVPLLTEKNDVSLSIQRSSSSKHSGAEFQGAYMPTKHIGLITSYSAGDNKKIDNLRYNRFEIGAGYTTGIDSFWHFETYAGYGTGSINNYHYTGHSRINNNYFFIQPAIFVSNSKKTLQLAFVSKFAGNHFNVTEASFTKDREPFTASQIDLLNDKPFHVFWEPGLVFRFGWEQVLFHTGFSYSTDLTNSKLYRANANLSLGITLKLNTTNL